MTKQPNLIKTVKKQTKPLQGYEDSDFDSFQWPNEKILWVRLIIAVIVGFTIALSLVAGVVMLVNKIMEQ